MSGANRPLIIEFAGLPGSGKTTLVNCIVEMERRENLGLVSFRDRCQRECRRNGIARRCRRVTGAASLLVKRRGTMLHLLRYALFSQPFDGFRMSCVGDFVRLAQQLDLRSAGAPGESQAELLDHGFVQTLGSMAVPCTSARPQKLGMLVACALADWVDGLVWVECSPETALCRVRGRVGGGSRFDRWPDEIFRENQTMMLRVLRDAVRQVGAAGVPVLTITAADPPAVNALRVRAWLQSLFSCLPRARVTDIRGGRD